MSAIALKTLIDGSDIQASLMDRHGTISRVEITKELNRHAQCQIELSQTAGTCPPIDKWVGRPISVRSSSSDANLFVGFVYDVNMSYQTSGKFSVEIKSISSSYKLDHAPRYRYYGPASVSDVAQQIADESAIKIAVKAGGGVKSSLDLVQWGETDWDFSPLVDFSHREVAAETLGPANIFEVVERHHQYGFTQLTNPTSVKALQRRAELRSV